MYTNRLDNIFDNFFGDKFFNTPWNCQHQSRPEVNIYQDEKGYELEFKAPGLAKNDVDIEIEENKLSISSNYSDKDGFKRVFELPEGSDQSNISAELKDGIIRINIPKIPKPEPRKIEVQSA